MAKTSAQRSKEYRDRKRETRARDDPNESTSNEDALATGVSRQVENTEISALPETEMDGKTLQNSTARVARKRERAEGMKLYRKSFSFSRKQCERERSRVRSKKARDINRNSGKKDVGAAERSKLYRYRHQWYCTYPPCNKIKRVDGVWHHAKYCPHLFPDGRRLMMEELKRKGEITCDYLPEFRLGYHEGWVRKFATEKWTTEFVSERYIDVENKRKNVALDLDNKLSIWDGAESDDWDDEEYKNSKALESCTVTGTHATESISNN